MMYNSLSNWCIKTRILSSLVDQVNWTHSEWHNILLICSKIFLWNVSAQVATMKKVMVLQGNMLKTQVLNWRTEYILNLSEKQIMNTCKNFSANFFDKNKCQNCFKPRESHLQSDKDLNKVMHWKKYS